MKRVSFIALLTIVYPELVLGYNYTITDENIRSHSYSVEQINQSVYDTAISQNANAPVFKTLENGETNYYRWSMPDLIQYKTPSEENVFSEEYNGNWGIGIYIEDENSNFIYRNYYVSDLTSTNNTIINSSNIDSVSNNFIANSASAAVTNYGNIDLVSGFFARNSGAIINDSNATISAINGQFFANTNYSEYGGINSDTTIVNNGNIGTITGEFIANYGVIENNSNIDSIDGLFIENFNSLNSGGAVYNTENSIIGSVRGDFIGNRTNGDGGAIYNNGSITTVAGDFVHNNGGFTKGGAIANDKNGIITSIEGNFIENTSYAEGSAVFNRGTINSIVGKFDKNGFGGVDTSGTIANIGNVGSISGDFISNKANFQGGAIWNNSGWQASGIIDSVYGNFIGNTSGSGGAVYNNGTINSLSGNFIDNHAVEADYNYYGENNEFYGGAIYNNKTMTLVNNVLFSGNTADVGGAIYNAINSTMNINVDENSSVRFVTNSDNVYNDGTITATGSGSNATGLFLQSVTGDGVFSLNNIRAELADGAILSQSNFSIDENSVLYANGGTLSGNITGDGHIIINGDVVSNISLTQDTTINSDKSLTISIDNIENSNITNNGTLLFNGGTLSKNLSNYDGNIGNVGALSANADYIDKNFTNNGRLTLAGGILNANITGSGNIGIDGDVISNTNIGQYITILPQKSFLTSADNISSDLIYNDGILTLTDGTLNADILIYSQSPYNYNETNCLRADCGYYHGGSVIIDGDVVSNATIAQNMTINSGKSLTVSADNIGNGTYYDMQDGNTQQTTITNNGTLNFTGGTLSRSINGSGNMTSSGTLFANANYISQNMENNGTLNLTGGTLLKQINGTGKTINTGDLYADLDNINQGFTNNGTLNISGGTLSGQIAGTGNIINIGNLTAVADYIGQNFTNNGTLTLTGGTLINEAFRNKDNYYNSFGNIIIDGDVVSNVNFGRNGSGYFDITVNEGKTLSTSANNISYAHNSTLTNNGILKLTDGELIWTQINGSGSVVVDGDVTFCIGCGDNWGVNQNVIINNGKTLTANANSIRANKLTNNGLLKLKQGTLNENISNFSNVEIISLATDARYLDREITIDQSLSLTGGTLNNSINGSGTVYISGNVEANANITPGLYIGDYSSLKISADNLHSRSAENYGTLTLTGGTFAVQIPQDYYSKGKIVVDGDVVSDVVLQQTTVINSGKSLTTSVDNIKNTALTNNGTLWFNAGTLDKVLSNYGNAGNIGTLNANANLINQAFINNGTLSLTEGVLNSKITGSGETFITGDVTNMTDYSQVINIANGGKLTTNADLLTNNAAINNAGILNINNGVLKNDVIGGKTIIGNNAVLESKNIADIDMGGTWNIDSDTVHASNANVNGLINIDITKINADSDKYAGGKLIADNIILDKNSELRLFVSANNLKKGESTGDLSVIEASAWDGNWHNIFQTNNKYDLSYDDIMHTVKITYTKTAADIILEFGGSKNDIAVGTAWDNESVFSDEFIDFAIRKMIERLNYAIQYDIEDYIKMLESIAPNDTHVASGTSRSVNNAINNQVSNRLAHVGRSGGDAFSGVGVWGQGLFNHSSQSGSADFSANTFGLSLGADKKINNTTLFGLGYAFNNTTAVSGARDISSIGHTVFVYGEYRPMLLSKDSGYRASRFHVNGMASYGVASYTEDTYDGVSSEYDTTSIGLNGNIEYDITSAFSLFTGGRYIKVSQDDYFDSLGQKVSVQDEDIITARVGAKYVGDYTLFVPNAHIGISYDVKSSDRLAIVNTANSSYQITGDAISPFGVQAGIGFVMNIDDWDISLNYDLDWHYEFISHTGRIKAKYMF